MKVKTIMLASCLLLLLGACNMFQEDCGMKGYLRAYVSVWRANLCATFLGNLVYPTPASKMLHFP